jgi:hypothetical protein
MTVQQTSACGSVALPPVLVTLSGTPSSSFVGSSATTNGGGQATVSGTFTEVGTGVTVTASAPGYASVTSQPFTVFPKGDLGCDVSTTPDLDAAPPGSRFSGSPPGVDDPFQTAYMEGVRGPNKDGSPCILVNYSVTNNVTGAVAMQDILGNVVPPNGVSFVWDRMLQPNLTAIYMVTFRSEWVGPDGVAALQTRVCTDAACSSQELLQSCLGNTLVVASLPPGKKACKMQEVTVTVPAGDPYYCPLPAPAVPAPACVQNRVMIMDIFDPVVIRN